MKILSQLGALLLFCIVFQFCSPQKPPQAQPSAEEELIVSVAQDTTPRVTGIGGIFFKDSSPEETSKWYGEHLGLAIDPYGSPFEFRNSDHPEELNYLRWAPFEKDSDYFEPGGREFMINYRVQNLDGLIRNLKADGITILDSIATYPYGKFVHIQDNNGRKIELWEPVDSFFTAMNTPTTK